MRLARKPLSLAVCVETRSALVCGVGGLARWVPFEELGISAERAPLGRGRGLRRLHRMQGRLE